MNSCLMQASIHIASREAGESHPQDNNAPHANMARLPSTLFPRFHGSRVRPMRRPTMSANPSPAHIIEMAQIPGRLLCQPPTATATSTRAYTSGPRRSSSRPPDLLIELAIAGMSTAPDPTRTRKSAYRPGGRADISALELDPLHTYAPWNKVMLQPELSVKPF